MKFFMKTSGGTEPPKGHSKNFCRTTFALVCNMICVIMQRLRNILQWNATVLSATKN